MHQFKIPLVGWACLPAALWLLVASSLSAATFNVADYGARPDDPALASPAIQKAIDAAAQAGGGKVVFAKGTYLTGALFLKSNVELQLGEGVVLRAVQDEAAYPEYLVARGWN
jgi:polygalacturonase